MKRHSSVSFFYTVGEASQLAGYSEGDYALLIGFLHELASSCLAAIPCRGDHESNPPKATHLVKLHAAFGKLHMRGDLDSKVTFRAAAQ